MLRVIFAWRKGYILQNEEFLFKRGAYEVKRYDADCLLYNRVASTQVIDSLMYILHCLNREPGANWSFVRCAHTDTVPHLTPLRLRLPEFKSYSKEEMCGSRWVFIPVESLGHWFLVVFDFYDKEVKVYNSLQNSERFSLTANHVTRLWKPFLRHVMGRDDVMLWRALNKKSPPIKNLSMLPFLLLR